MKNWIFPYWICVEAGAKFYKNLLCMAQMPVEKHFQKQKTLSLFRLYNLIEKSVHDE